MRRSVGAGPGALRLGFVGYADDDGKPERADAINSLIPARARLRQLLQKLGATSVAVTFESRQGQYRLLSYRTRPVQHRLAEQLTQELKAFAMAQIRQGLPWTPSQDGKRGWFSWTLGPDHVEIGH